MPRQQPLTHGGFSQQVFRLLRMDFQLLPRMPHANAQGSGSDRRAARRRTTLAWRSTPTSHIANLINPVTIGQAQVEHQQIRFAVANEAADLRLEGC